MRWNVSPLKAGVVFIVWLFAGGSMASTVSSAAPSGATSCETPPYRQFDFWAGDWDVFDVGSPVKVAHARVDLILDGCVLREDYEGADGHKGQSFTIYDATRNLWHQSWVTNRGQLLTIEGKMEAGMMILTGEDHAGSGKTLVRGTWKPQGGEIRETAVTSNDGGKTWKPWFDLVFRPNASGSRNSSSDAEEKKALVALDTEYQAAVKKNDADAMARILSDDFVLVSSSGKTYTKAELLAEARSGRVLYDHQDDSEQTVRVWGDTAVITAKLWEKGMENGKPFEYVVWFSDTYLRTPTGWRYVFGQAGAPLPNPVH